MEQRRGRREHLQHGVVGCLLQTPLLRDVHEYILIFTKGKFGRNKGTNTITRDQFLEYTKSIWNFKPERAKHVGHPAPFPENYHIGAYIIFIQRRCCI